MQKLLFYFGSDDFFQGDCLLNGINVKVENFGQRSESFSSALQKIKPNNILLYEPILEFMRAVEIYNSEI